MRRYARFCFLVLLLLGAACPASLPAGEPLPLLEKYTLDTLGEARGVTYDLFDQSFGGGDARSRLLLIRRGGSRTLTLTVWRRVRAGTTSFALLGERVEVRGYEGDSLIYSRDFAGLEQEGIFFGDSRSGNWRRTLKDIPLAVRRLEVTFLGNYE
jgi:hypothetical protein